MAEAATETELKLELSPNDVVQLEAQPLLEAASASREIQTLDSVYFDTKDQALHAAGIALRVRHTGGRYLQTVKIAKDGLSRSEWESEVPHGWPDLAIAKATGLKALTEIDDASMLGPVFSTRVRRTVYPIRIDGGLVEAGLDQGEIITGEQHAPICELELELKQGEPAILFEVARAFSVVVPVTLGVRTKPERGYAMLAQGTADPIEKAKDLILAPVMPAEQAFRITARACLRQLIANVPATCAGKDEGLHQMRIGIRRLRAAINAFAEIVEDNRSEDIKKTLKWMIKSLGPARDLDVLARQIETSRPAGEHAGLIDKLMRTLQEKRELAYARAAGAIRSTRFGTGLIELAEWIEYGAWANAEDEREWLDEAVALHAAEELARRRRKIRKRGEKLRKLGDRERHKLRIRAKALRYIVEFFASLFPGHKREKRREAALSALKDLQDALGELNDIAAHRGILREAAIAAADGHAEMTDLADLADNLAGPAQEKRVESLLKAAEKAHAKFAETKAFWK